MKLVRLAFLLFFFVLGVSAIAEAKPKLGSHHVSVLSIKREIFYFKVDSEFIGATIEVYDSTGILQQTANVTRRRTIVDFFYMNPGIYTVRFAKGDMVEEFKYSVWIR